MLKIPSNHSDDNLVVLMKKIYGEDTFDKMLVYGEMLSAMYNMKDFTAFCFNNNVTKELLEENLNSEIVAAILNGNIKYSENMENYQRYNTKFIRDEWHKSQ